MDIKLLFSILGAIILIMMFAHYYHGIFKWKIKPHSYTWLIFTLILTLSFFIQINNWGWFWTYVLWLDALACVVTFLLSLKYWEKDIKSSDKISLLLALFAIVLWILFDVPVISVILIICIDLLGLLPTFRKSYMKPYEETITMYFLSWVIFLFSAIAIDSYSFLTVWHQLAIIIFDWWLVLFLLYRRKILPKK